MLLKPVRPRSPIFFPKELIANESSLLKEFRRIERGHKVIAVRADILYYVLPPPLKQAPVFYDKSVGIWRYQFGKPFYDAPSGTVTFGPNQWPPVERLYRGLRAAKIHLDNAAFAKIVKRLGEVATHMNALVELSPLSRVDLQVEADYEVETYSPGNRNVDWMFRCETGKPILLEVKNRVKDQLELKQAPSEGAISKVLSSPSSNYSWLFASIVEKFQPSLSNERLQGVWIEKRMKLSYEGVSKYFHSLDAQRVHFAIFGNEGDDAAIFIRHEIDKEYLLNFFKLVESGRFFF